MYSRRILKTLIVIVLSFGLLFTLGVSKCERVVEETIELEESLEDKSLEDEVESIEETLEDEEEIIEVTIYDMVFYSNLENPSIKDISSYSIYGCMLDGSEISPIYNSGTGDLDPQYNSDYSKIVFSSFMDGDNDSDIYIYDFKTGEVTKVIDRVGNDFSPDFSPDDSTIVFQGFVARDSYLESEIFTVNIDGTDLMQLTKNEFYDGLPDFSPDQDQSQIMFTSDRDGSNKIYTMKTDGTGVMQRTNFGDWNDFDGCFSTDGHYAVFVSDRTGDYDIWAVLLVEEDEPDLQLELSMMMAYNISENPANDMLPAYGPNENVIAYLTDRQYENFIYNITWTELTGKNTWTESEPVEEFEDTIMVFDQEHPFGLQYSLNFK